MPSVREAGRGFPVGPLSCSRSNSTAAISVCRRQRSKVRVTGGTGDPGATAASSSRTCSITASVHTPSATSTTERLHWCTDPPTRSGPVQMRWMESARSLRQVVDICESRAGSSTRSTSVAAASIWPHIQSLIRQLRSRNEEKLWSWLPASLELASLRVWSNCRSPVGLSPFGSGRTVAKRGSGSASSEGQVKDAASGVPALPEIVRYRMRSRLPAARPDGGAAGRDRSGRVLVSRPRWWPSGAGAAPVRAGARARPGRLRSRPRARRRRTRTTAAPATRCAASAPRGRRRSR